MKVNKIKFLGVMIFVTVLMDVVPRLGFIAIGNISITSLHIPTILTSIVLGPLYGTIMGIVFGVVSMFRAMSREATLLDEMMTNPLVAILPRLCIGIVSGYIYLLLNRLLKCRYVSIVLAAVLGTFTNTVLVFTMLFTIYEEELIGIFNVSGKMELILMMINSFLGNMLVEAVLSAVVCSILIYIFHKIWKKQFI